MPSLPIPEIDRVVSATAPLSHATGAGTLRRAVMSLMMEIYGSTETGQIASRRRRKPQNGDCSRCKMVMEGDHVRAAVVHVETLITMSDVIEPVSEEHFLLADAFHDMVNMQATASWQSQSPAQHIRRDGAHFSCGRCRDERVAGCVCRGDGMDPPMVAAYVKI
jgi:hypothetical protein